jgi:hypothetical protein
MSIRATNFTRRLRGLTFAEGRAALILGDHANYRTGEITISMETLAEECELSSRQAASAIKNHLVDAKVFLEPNPSKGGRPSTLYVNYQLADCNSRVMVAPPSNRNPRIEVNHNSPNAVPPKPTAIQNGPEPAEPQFANAQTAIPGLQEGVLREKKERVAPNSGQAKHTVDVRYSCQQQLSSSKTAKPKES